MTGEWGLASGDWELVEPRVGLKMRQRHGGRETNRLEPVKAVAAPTSNCHSSEAVAKQVIAAPKVPPAIPHSPQGGALPGLSRFKVQGSRFEVAYCP